MKTAGELQITQQEYDALVKTRELLASGKVVWQDRNVEAEFYESDQQEPMQFNMSTIRSGDDCTTVCCIGGWMAHTMGMTDRWDAIDFVNNKMSRSLGELCFPEPGIMNYIRPEHAVKAIDNFLDTGVSMWRHVLELWPVREEIEDARHRQIEVSESHKPAIVNMGRRMSPGEVQQRERAMIESKAKALGYSKADADA